MGQVPGNRESLTTPVDELAAIRKQLGSIEQILEPLFGDTYSRKDIGLRSRRAAARLIEQNFDETVDQWVSAVERILILPYRSEACHPPATLRSDLAGALRRFVDHLKDPDNLTTYTFLQRHCQQGILAQIEPSQFDAIHIALKQVVLNHVRTKLKGRRMEMVRDAVVAAVDERRMTVSSFYIESRERALRASEEKYRSAIDHAPDGMYEIDPESGVIIGANAAAKRLPCSAGGEPASPVGRRIIDLVPTEKAEEVKKHLHAVLANGTAQLRELSLVCGCYFDVNSALIPFGNRRFIQMILRDVTQRREMLDGLLKAERLAAAGILAAGIAHEVNNPLASISSLVQSLLAGEDDEGRRTALHTILAQIGRISATVKELVDFAHPSSAQRKAVDLNAMIGDTLRLVAYNKRFSGIRLEPHLSRNLMPVFVDENEIRQVLLNLLLNAADATQNGAGLIRITTENRASRQGVQRGIRVAMLISDNGIGIPREHLARVFDPFFTTKPPGAGVGLGLSACQRMVLANGGTIGIDSQVGQGTTVTVCMPALEDRQLSYSA